MHALVGLHYPDSIDLSHSHKLGQGTENRFYRTLPLALHIYLLCGLCTPELFLKYSSR